MPKIIFMPKYITIKDLENYLLVDIDLSFYEQIEKWIEAAESSIEQITGRVFVASEKETRLYSGDGERTLIIDDAQKIENVMINETKITDFLTEPANKLPITCLYRKAGWPRGRQNIKVEAIWGYSEEAPQDVKLAATIMAANLVQASSGDSNAKSITMGRLSLIHI